MKKEIEGWSRKRTCKYIGLIDTQINGERERLKFWQKQFEKNRNELKNHPGDSEDNIPKVVFFDAMYEARMAVQTIGLTLGELKKARNFMQRRQCQMQ